MAQLPGFRTGDALAPAALTAAAPTRTGIRAARIAADEYGLERVLRLCSSSDGRFLRPSQHAQVGDRALARLGRDGGASIGLG
jgi:hypothetical protein